MNTLYSTSWCGASTCSRSGVAIRAVKRSNGLLKLFLETAWESWGMMPVWTVAQVNRKLRWGHLCWVWHWVGKNLWARRCQNCFVPGCLPEDVFLWLCHRHPAAHGHCRSDQQEGAANKSPRHGQSFWCWQDCHLILFKILLNHCIAMQHGSNCRAEL